jgi:hypothetical protein
MPIVSEAQLRIRHYARMNNYLFLALFLTFLGILAIAIDVVTVDMLSFNKLLLDICSALFTVGYAVVYLIAFLILVPVVDRGQPGLGSAMASSAGIMFQNGGVAYPAAITPHSAHPPQVISLRAPPPGRHMHEHVSQPSSPLRQVNNTDFPGAQLPSPLSKSDSRPGTLMDHNAHKQLSDAVQDASANGLYADTSSQEQPQPQQHQEAQLATVKPSPVLKRSPDGFFTVEYV